MQKSVSINRSETTSLSPNLGAAASSKSKADTLSGVMTPDSPFSCTVITAWP